MEFTESANVTVMGKNCTVTYYPMGDIAWVDRVWHGNELLFDASYVYRYPGAPLPRSDWWRTAILAGEAVERHLQG